MPHRVLWSSIFSCGLAHILPLVAAALCSLLNVDHAEKVHLSMDVPLLERTKVDDPQYQEVRVIAQVATALHTVLDCMTLALLVRPFTCLRTREWDIVPCYVSLKCISHSSPVVCHAPTISLSTVDT